VLFVRNPSISIVKSSPVQDKTRTRGIVIVVKKKRPSRSKAPSMNMNMKSKKKELQKGENQIPCGEKNPTIFLHNKTDQKIKKVR
jgi:hypothetical protein